jgi:hypothetical protein
VNITWHVYPIGIKAVLKDKSAYDLSHLGSGSHRFFFMCVGKYSCCIHVN